MPIRTVFVANRAEIARRVFRTARRLGLRTVAVASAADRDLPHAREADRTVLLDGPSALDPRNTDTFFDSAYWPLTATSSNPSPFTSPSPPTFMPQ